jgi:membrane-bound lytic murein transglycosylase A
VSVSPYLHPVEFSDLPGWQEDEQQKAFGAFCRSARHALPSPYKTGSIGIPAEAFRPAYEAALQAGDLSNADARAFFETFFRPHRIKPEQSVSGFVTGYYEPEVEASPVERSRFAVPLLGVPDDLVKITDDNRPDGFDPYLAFARQTEAGIVEYFDRAAIDQGAIADRAKPIAWLASKVDAFFIHVQGSARLIMPDGKLLRVTYAAKSGQRFTGAGMVLAELGEIPLSEVTMQSIRAWFAQNPSRTDEILHRNRSYIFFKEADVTDPALGPIGAGKVPLTTGRSMAVDRLLHTFGTPIFVSASTLGAFGPSSFERLMIAQDTGSAIVGTARGDLFTGSGHAAGEIAGVIKHPADFFALVPATRGNAS